MRSTTPIIENTDLPQSYEHASIPINTIPALDVDYTQRVNNACKQQSRSLSASHMLYLTHSQFRIGQSQPRV